MTAFLTWLGGKAGRITMTIVAAAAAIFVVILKAYSSGKASEQAKQADASLEALRSREEIDDDATKLPDDRARNDLSGWVRPDGS